MEEEKKKTILIVDDSLESRPHGPKVTKQEVL